MALLRGPSNCSHLPQAPLTYGQCALGLAQVKAVGLVEVYDLTTVSCLFPLTCGQGALGLVQVKAVGLGEVFDLTTVPSLFLLILFLPRDMVRLVEGGSEVLMNC